MARVLVINGHPDPGPERLTAALADACAEGAAAAGHEVVRLAVGALEFPVLRSRQAYERGLPCPAIARAQAALTAAEHVILLLPIWLGGPPALLTAFLEQTLRPGFAREPGAPGRPGRALLGGRSVRIVATMAMPALAYRFWYWGHGLANLRVGVLGFVGFAPIRTTLIGGAGVVAPERAARLTAQMRALGAAAR